VQATGLRMKRDLMKYRAVIFDLFGTLVGIFSVRDHERALKRMADVVGAPADDFVRMWGATYSNRAKGFFDSPAANIEHICRHLGVLAEAAQIGIAARIRVEHTASLMVPRPDAIDVLSYLKSQGCRIGLISDCSAEIPSIWGDSPFDPLVDVAVFSCSVGLTKPDPVIYRLATDQLEVAPGECLYVGDGSSRELTGAAAVGMDAVQIRVPGEDQVGAYRTDIDNWNGPAVASLTDVLALIK